MLMTSQYQTYGAGMIVDVETDLAGVPGGYRDMDERRSLKVLVRL